VTRRIAVVAEDAGGASLVRECCDAALRRVEWIAGHEDLSPFREFLAPAQRDHFKVGDALGTSSRGHKLRVLGHFGSAPGDPDATSFRRMYAWLQSEWSPDCVLVARDCDQEERRRNGMRQARDSTHLQVAVALMVPESEAWRIALVDPASKAEVLAELRAELGFDPVAQPHLLSSSPESKREAKAIASRLYGDDPPAIDDRAIDLLSAQEGCGAAQHLRELHTAVVEPIVGRAAR
jgi:hypothetical protein